jgi:hypothetical protein
MRSTHLLIVGAILLAGFLSAAAAAPPQKKDYLSSLEADKIRDALDNNQRIKLFLDFAADRLKKFQYELDHPSPRGHADMLNSLLNAYVGCVDDAADRIQEGVEHQENIHVGINLLIKRGGEFLPILEKLAAEGPESQLYKETLDDAIEGTHDAIHDAESALKEVAPPPVRRRD